MHDRPIAAGKSSFDLVDKDVFFREVRLPEGGVLLDAACGAGRYSLALSPRMGGKGLIHAIDLWEEGIRSLEGTIRAEGISNIRPLVGDVRRTPLEGSSVDAALFATVLHDLAEAGTAEEALAETRRVLRPAGRLYVVEFKKIDGPPGPPQRVRISGDELREMAAPFGFSEERSVETGPDTYLSVFRLEK